MIVLNYVVGGLAIAVGISAALVIYAFIRRER